MDSEILVKLPFIDFSNLDPKSRNLDWDLTKSYVHRALEEFGCFEATFGNIPPEIVTSMFDSLWLLFDLPLPTKLKYSSTTPHHGYVGQYPMMPLYESMGIDDVTVSERIESFINILWPEGNPEFRKTIQELSEKLSKLDEMVRMMVMESLGLEKYIDEHLDSTNYLLRVMKYKGTKTDESEVGLRCHTDKNMVTIIHQNQVDGLEVQTKSGNWIKIQPSPNTFIIVIGDSLHAWTNGRLHSPYHRVMMNGEKERYSFGLFSMPKAGYMIKAPSEMVDEEHPLLFKPFDHADFLRFYYTEAGGGVQSALKTYCGV